MINVNDLKVGMTIMYENNIYSVMDTQHVKPGKGAAFVQAKLKNLRSGSIIENRFNSSDKVEPARIEKKPMQYLYSMNDVYYFMDMNTYEQVEISKAQIGDDAELLKENLEVDIMFFEGEMLGMNLPDKIALKVTHTEPAVKGNTTNNALKDATVETGLLVRVPLFIEEGETIVVSTSDGKYVSRA